MIDFPFTAKPGADQIPGVGDIVTKQSLGLLYLARPARVTAISPRGSRVRVQTVELPEGIQRGEVVVLDQEVLKSAPLAEDLSPITLSWSVEKQAYCRSNSAILALKNCYAYLPDTASLFSAKRDDQSSGQSQ